jgi:hypothetical protein
MAKPWLEQIIAKASSGSAWRYASGGRYVFTISSLPNTILYLIAEEMVVDSSLIDLCCSDISALSLAVSVLFLARLDFCIQYRKRAKALLR